MMKLKINCIAGFQCQAIQNRSKHNQNRSIDKVQNLGIWEKKGGTYTKTLAKI